MERYGAFLLQRVDGDAFPGEREIKQRGAESFK